MPETLQEPEDALDQRIAARLKGAAPEAAQGAEDDIDQRIAARVAVYSPSPLEKVVIGAAEGMASLVEAPDLALKALEHIIPRETLLQQIPNIKAGAEWLAGVGKELRDETEAIAPARLRDQGFLSQLEYGAGSMAPMVASSFIGGEVAPFLGASARFGQLAGTAAAGAAQSSVPMYHDILAATVDAEHPEGDERKAMMGAALGLGIGATEVVGVGSILSKLNRGTGGGLVRYLTSVATGALEEGAQEAFQQTLQDAAMTSLTPQEMTYLERLESAGKAGALGLVLGGGVHGFAHGLRITANRGAGVPESAQAPEPDRRAKKPLQATLSGVRQETGTPETAPESTGAPIEAPGGAQPAPLMAGSEVTGESPGEVPSSADRQPSAPQSAGAGTYAHTDEPASNSSVQPGDRLSPVEVTPIDSLREFNPGKRVEEAKVRAIMAEMEAGKPLPPVIADRAKEGDKAILGDGSHRIEAAKRLGYTSVPVRFVEPKPEAMKVPTMRTSDVIDSMRRLVQDFEIGNGDELPASLQTADSVLEQRKLAGIEPTEYDKHLAELVKIGRTEAMLEIETPEQHAQAERTERALSKAHTLINAAEKAEPYSGEARRSTDKPARPLSPEEEMADRILRGELVSHEELATAPGAIKRASVKAQRGEKPSPPPKSKAGHELGSMEHLREREREREEREGPDVSDLPIRVSAGDVPKELAVRAFTNTSHSPEERGASVQRDYLRAMDNAHTRLEPLADTPEKKAMLAAELEAYRGGYLKRLRAYLEAHSRVASPMITGPAAFPVERNRKAGAVADRRAAELAEYQTRALAAISKKLTADERAAALAERHPGRESREVPFEGGVVRLDRDADRLRIAFDDKPGKETIATLRKAGFKWAPSVGAWQRQWTLNAELATERLLGVPINEKSAAPPRQEEAAVSQPSPPEVDRGSAPPVEAQAPTPQEAAEAPPGAAQTSGGSPPPTSIKNATVERELANMGLPPPQHGESVSDIERHGRAMETLRADPQAGARLVADLEAAPRAPSADEGAMLALEVNRLLVERDAAQDAYNADPSEANQARIDRAVSDYARAADVVTRAGTHSAQSLRIRRMMIARDYSLAEMERSIQAAKGGEPLTDSERAQVAELHEKLAATAKAHEEYVSGAEQKRAELEAENALLRLKQEVGSKPHKLKRAAKIAETQKELDSILEKLANKARQAGAFAGIPDPETVALAFQAAAKAIELGARHFAAWAEQIVARVGEHIRPYLQQAWDDAQRARALELAAPLKEKLASGAELATLGQPIQKIAESFVAQGITEREALVDAVYGVMEQAGVDITRRQTMDAISGYGDFKPLSKDETKAKLRDLKGQMQQVAKIEELQAGLAPLKTGVERRTPSDIERRLIKQVNELKRKLGIRVSDPETQLKSALDARKTWLTNRIADLEDQISRNDFAPRPKRPPMQLDAEATKLKADYEEVRRKFETRKRMHELANRTRTQKILAGVREAIDLPKAIMTAWDLSAVLRQGGFFSLGDPVTTLKVHIPRMIAAAVSERSSLETDVMLRNRPLYAFGEASKLELTRHGDDLGPHEEAIRSAISDKIPGIKASNRAFVTFLNQQRAHAFDSIVQSMPTAPTLEQGRAIANFVNIATGRGNPGRFAGAMSALAIPLWSPRLLLSRFQILAGQPFYGGDAATRTRIAKQYARFLIGLAGTYGLAKVAGSWMDDKDKPTIETDPRSADLGKIRIGNTRIDPLAGLSQVTVLLSRLALGETKSSTTGKVTPIRGDVPFGKSTAADVVSNFLRSKLSPTIGVPLDLLSGENMIGEPVTPLSVAKDLLVPLSFQDIKQAMQERGVAAGAALGILSIFGAGVQTYEQRKAKAKKAAGA